MRQPQTGSAASAAFAALSAFFAFFSFFFALAMALALPDFLEPAKDHKGYFVARSRQTAYVQPPARSALARPATMVPSAVCSMESISPCWCSRLIRSPRS